MKLFLLSQNSVNGYDTYDSCVVVAESEELARQIHPDGGTLEQYKGNDNLPRRWHYDWTTDSKDVTVTYLGEYVPGDHDADYPVVCASFNAG